MINRDYEKYGLTFFTLPKKKGNGSDISNTYAISLGDKWYIIDTSCGRKRYHELKEFLSDKKSYTILSTHYHNDHIANNGRLAGKNSRIIYHENARRKVPYLRTNGTGQILKMYNDLDKRGFLKRLGFFSDRFIDFMLKTRLTSRYIMIPLLFTVSYLFSLRSIGRIYSGRKRISYLYDNNKIRVNLNGTEYEGWEIGDEMYAFETPGHTDCHLVFYASGKKILFTGDALNFLTPNDIQFGDLNSTIKTQKQIYSLAEKENISIICQGHYTPLEGNGAIKEYISDTIQKHEHVYNTIRDYIDSEKIKLPFDELYKKICELKDPVIQRLVKITFPVSTLVFLDVYVHKMIDEIKKNKDTSAD